MSKVAIPVWLSQNQLLEKNICSKTRFLNRELDTIFPRVGNCARIVMHGSDQYKKYEPLIVATELISLKKITRPSDHLQQIVTRGLLKWVTI